MVDFSREPEASPRLRKLAGISAWFLLAGIIILVVSGWGITQTGVIYRFTFGLVDRKLADSIHRLANIPLVFFFLSHVLINIKLKISNRVVTREGLVNAVLTILGIGLMAITVYLELFRRGG